ncbi:uncharacterized protein LOC143888982 [Tasmannia lanceolata]|uniref:uncharacterized protein LOC143888982 n=1 Tax=Tasmannia lanceolata TaxID=3420 RepID=UPI004062A786
MASHIVGPLMLLPTSKQVWDQTTLLYSGVANISRICSTYSEWIRFLRGDMSTVAHYSQFAALCQQLDVFMPLTSDLTVVAHQRDQMCGVITLRQVSVDGSCLAAYDSGSRSSRGGASFGRGGGCGGRGGGHLSRGQRCSFCTYCQREGHHVDISFQLHPKLRSPRSTHITAAGLPDTYIPSDSAPVPAKDTLTISRVDYDEFRCLRLSICTAITSFAQTGSSPASLLSSSNSWIIDYGASNHLTGNSSSLSSFRHFPSDSHSVTLADGTSTPISGIGTLSPHSGLFIFCFDLSIGSMIGSGREHDGLYRLDSSPPRHILHNSVVSYLWHCRLGHPSLQKLRQLSVVSSTVQSFDCESCELGKHCRVPFPSRVIVNQYNCIIKCLCTDNAREYFSTEFQDFLSSRGIVHQSSFAYTSQQNGLAERKLRYLLDITRSMLFSNGANKLNRKVEKCVFLRYSRTQKGYRCYIPWLRRMFVSTDVTFFESEPFFPPTSGDASVISASLLPLPIPVLHDPIDHPSPPTTDALCHPPPVTKVYQRRAKEKASNVMPEQVSSQTEIPAAATQVSVASSPVTSVDSPIVASVLL